MVDKITSTSKFIKVYNKIIAKGGRQADVARSLGVTRQAVNVRRKKLGLKGVSFEDIMKTDRVDKSKFVNL